MIKVRNRLRFILYLVYLNSITHRTVDDANLLASDVYYFTQGLMYSAANHGRRDLLRACLMWVSPNFKKHGYTPLDLIISGKGLGMCIPDLLDAGADASLLSNYAIYILIERYTLEAIIRVSLGFTDRQLHVALDHSKKYSTDYKDPTVRYFMARLSGRRSGGVLF